MAKFDFSGDGFIQFDGFVMLLIKIKQLTAAFQEEFYKFNVFWTQKTFIKFTKPFDQMRNGTAYFTYEQFLTVVIENS